MILSRFQAPNVSSISEFTSNQLEAFERIGFSGELFKEVLAEYERQGMTKEDA